MLNLYTGDRKLIKQQIEKLAKKYKVEVKYSTNILFEMQRQYGLFFTPCLFYFIFDPKEFSDKDSVDELKKLAMRSKIPIVCIIETNLDKRSSFYKIFHKEIKQLGGITDENIVTQFYNDIETITKLEPKDAVSFLYKIYYSPGQYKEIAGYCINLVLTGRVTTDLILKIFLAKILDKSS